MSLFRESQIGFVTPLHDGMNLVAKEYVAAQKPDDPGVLVLSIFARRGGGVDGRAARQSARCDRHVRGACSGALQMPLDARQRRHEINMAALRKNDLGVWRDSFLRDLRSVPIQATGRGRRGTGDELAAIRNIQPRAAEVVGPQGARAPASLVSSDGRVLSALAIAGYRSLRELIVPLGRLNVITGANGSGKSSVYRSLRLLAETARGGVITSLAREGGLPSTLWAGPERFSRGVLSGEFEVEPTARKTPVSLRLGFAGEQFSYAIDLGLPLLNKSTRFMLDPVVKRECIWSGPVLRPSALLVDRQGPALRTRDESGEWQTVPQPVASFDSMMTEFADPRSAPEMIAVREQIRSWRFYDHFRTDVDAPARMPQVGTHTPVLSDDGADLAAALQNHPRNRRFDGARRCDRRRLSRLAARDCLAGRPLRSADAAARPAASAEGRGIVGWDLALSAAGRRAVDRRAPPALLVLNEPETRLHPDLLPALARLIARAAAHSQVLVVSHAARLIAALEREDASESLVLEKHFGATRLGGRRRTRHAGLEVAVALNRAVRCGVYFGARPLVS